MSGLIGKKVGMTQTVDAAGRVRAVTVIQLGPCAVSQIKTGSVDGYDAVQVTWGRKKHSRATHAEQGHFRKAEVAPGAATREFVRRGEGEIKLGQMIAAQDVFAPGDAVDVSGISKGHGYAGVIKRHHFAGFPNSRGTHEYFRHGGSIGNRSFPGRVRKGLRMAGQMGNERVTVVNQQVLEIIAEDNLVLVSGAVPGADNGIVVVRHAAKQTNLAPERQANG
ncbi:MAG: 50S ribosomal protein L3 [Deltaproteobacteria bacterium]|nr:50S ribosomal protein L3 [Deltaproteobacteria bacterium]